LNMREIYEQRSEQVAPILNSWQLTTALRFLSGGSEGRRSRPQ